jgi:hypothetical protein
MRVPAGLTGNPAVPAATRYDLPADPLQLTPIPAPYLGWGSCYVHSPIEGCSLFDRNLLFNRHQDPVHRGRLRCARNARAWRAMVVSNKLTVRPVSPPLVISGRQAEEEKPLAAARPHRRTRLTALLQEYGARDTQWTNKPTRGRKGRLFSGATADPPGRGW